MATSIPLLYANTEPPKDHREKSVAPESQPAKDIELICLHENFPDQQVRIDTSYQPSIRADLISFLHQNSEVFTLSYNYMPDIFLNIISYQLCIDMKVRLIR